MEIFVSHYLRKKHEYGTSYMCSESGIQYTAANYARRIAQEQGFNEFMAACICMAVGLCFPDFGSYGMAAYENYLSEKNILLDRKELKIDAIEFWIDQDGSIITPELDDALHAYYENRTDIPEVNVARFCQLKIKECRKLMKNGMRAGEALSTVMDSACGAFSAEKSIMAGDDTDIEVPAEVQEKIDVVLDELIEHRGLQEGIYTFFIEE